MSRPGVDGEEARAAFENSLGELRPKLHRYCARMTGSVIDGEDVVQEAMVKAINAFRGPDLSPISTDGCSASPTMRRWIFCAAGGATRLSIPTRSWR